MNLSAEYLNGLMIAGSGFGEFPGGDFHIIVRAIFRRFDILTFTLRERTMSQNRLVDLAIIEANLNNKGADFY